MKKMIAGNWKMFGAPAMAEALAVAVARHAETLPDVLEVVICPPATLLAQVSDCVAGMERTSTGGQSCHNRAEGAFTGDISAQMVKDAGADYVIIGHSERRQYHFETDGQIKEAAQLALKAGLTPIICVGESAEERQSGQAFEVVGAQVAACLPGGSNADDFVLAYEPVWAIGSGATPTLADIEAMHAHILSVAGRSRVLYGGSVKGDNARDILSVPGVSGVLVGGASLKEEEFCRIISAAV